MSAPTFHPESGINEDLLLRVLTQITEHPETHDQDDFGSRTACGTAHCVAGWAVVIARPEVVAWHQRYDGTEVMTLEGDLDLIWDLAAELLGLHPADQANALFSSNRTLDDLWVCAAKLTDGRVSRAAMPVVTA